MFIGKDLLPREALLADAVDLYEIRSSGRSLDHGGDLKVDCGNPGSQKLSFWAQDMSRFLCHALLPRCATLTRVSNE
jgi:hypothetical protein